MAKERVQRRLAAILAADVVGYSRLIEGDEEGTRARLRTVHAELIDPRITADGGRIVKTSGDGILVEFPSAIDAVRNALDVQGALRRRNADVAEENRIEFRVGINVGDVIVEGDDIHGDGVNVAARLEGLCGPGEVYLSGTVYDQAAGKVAASFEDLGEQTVKNMVKPIRVYRVSPETGSFAATAAASEVDTLFDRPAIAVLPFENLSGDPEQEYFADGMSEDIITALSLWRSFPVIARNSTFAYKGQSPDVRTVAKELGARYVLEGSIRRAGNRVRVAGQLIDANTGHHVWADRYDRELDDIFALQDEIAQRIAAIIEPTMEREERNRIVAKHPSELSAWEFCLRGFSLLNEETEEATSQAREMFRRAIEHDPYYSRPHTGLAFSYSHDLRFGWFETREESTEQLFNAARRAIALDEASWEAQTMMARAYIHVRQPEAALTEAKKAVELNPHSAYANLVLGVTLSVSLGRADEGIPWFERAIDLNPLDPRNHQFKVYLATAHLCAGRFETAIEYAEDAIRRRPDFVDGCIVLASAFGHLNRAEEACTAIGSLAEMARTSVERHEIWAESVKEHVLDGLRKAGLME